MRSRWLTGMPVTRAGVGSDSLTMWSQKSLAKSLQTFAICARRGLFGRLTTTSSAVTAPY